MLLVHVLFNTLSFFSSLLSETNTALLQLVSCFLFLVVFISILVYFPDTTILISSLYVLVHSYLKSSFFQFLYLYFIDFCTSTTFPNIPFLWPSHCLSFFCLLFSFLLHKFYYYGKIVLRLRSRQNPDLKPLSGAPSAMNTRPNHLGTSFSLASETKI